MIDERSDCLITGDIPPELGDLILLLELHLQNNRLSGEGCPEVKSYDIRVTSLTTIDTMCTAK